MAVKLRDYIEQNKDEKQLRELFYHMSKTMKYIHENQYCIKTFNLNEIEILDLEKLFPIQYNTVVKMNKENEEELRHEDIYNLAFMQIGIYADMLDVLRPEFLKEHFDSFIIFLPEEDVPYFRGIVIRGASVYYVDYINEKNKMMIVKLADQTDGGRSIQKSKSTAVGKAMADKEMKRLYSDINKPDAAYVSLLIFPLIMVILGLILSIVFLFI